MDEAIKEFEEICCDVSRKGINSLVLLLLGIVTTPGESDLYPMCPSPKTGSTTVKAMPRVPVTRMFLEWNFKPDSSEEI